MTEPTDAELEALFVEETGFSIDDFPAAILDFARAVLAKWGTPPAVAGEPVAWRYRPSAVWDDYVLTDDPGKAARARANGLHVEALCLTTPQPTQAQAGAREPLTDEQRSDIATAAAGFNWTDDYVEAIDYVIDGVESLHGIKGGQQGTAVLNEAREMGLGEPG